VKVTPARRSTRKALADRISPAGRANLQLVSKEDDPLIVGVPKECFPGERRVALVPTAVKTLSRLGVEVCLETMAGAGAGFPDAAYTDTGAKVTTDRDQLFRDADVITQVRACAASAEYGQADLKRLREGQVLIAQCEPLSDPEEMVALAERKAVVFALELVPRITRAQSMDVLSSMATISGYKSVLLAACELPQMFPMLMTAAGTLKPARVFVMGAGVAGLQAIATARRLGAVVQAYDVRPAVREQVQSLGAKFVEMPLEGAEGSGGYAKEMGEEFYRRQREFTLGIVAQSDVVITTAAIPGKQAPTLVTADMVQAMPPGSVIVDLAAERGGNCALTQPGRTIESHGVKILGPVNLPSTVPNHASQMYSNNVTTFFKLLIREGRLVLNLTDEVVAGTLLTRSGKLVHPDVRQLAGLGPLEDEVAPAPAADPALAGEDEPPADTYRLSNGD
jgi:NAD(P) transhydrogenase subunit alpha